MNKAKLSRGFTLVELLVVIAIIGILIGMLLPAVQSVREAARRSTCMNNTRQLVLAMLNYESAHMAFPNGELRVWGQPQTWITKSLPFIEQGNVANLLPNGIFTAAQAPIMQLGLPVLVCASEDYLPDGQLIAGGNVARAGWWWERNLTSTNYKACLGGNWHRNAVPFNRPGVGRHAGEMPDLESGDGMFPRNWIFRTNSRPYVDTTFGQLTDGSSNTLAIGEALPRWCDDCCALDTNGTLATAAIPINLFKTEITGRQTLAGDWQRSYGFSSNHTGGAVFGLADGSSHFIDESINIDTFSAMGTISGGEVVSVKNL